MTNPIPRFTSRAIHVLRTEGLDVLVKKIRRRLRVQVFRPLAPKFIQVDEPFAPLVLPVCGEQPRASLIIPCYQNFSQTHHCLSALCASGDKASFEVIIVIDDDPEGTTVERLKSYGNLCVISNGGYLDLLHSCNRGAAKTTGQCP